MTIAGQLLTTIIHALAFGGITLVCWLLPGMSLTRRLIIRTRLERLFLSLISGFSMYALSVFVVRLIELPFFVAFLPSGYLVCRLLLEKKTVAMELPAPPLGFLRAP